MSAVDRNLLPRSASAPNLPVSDELIRKVMGNRMDTVFDTVKWHVPSQTAVSLQEKHIEIFSDIPVKPSRCWKRYICCIGILLGVTTPIVTGLLVAWKGSK
jgi:hypothetical protein